ncbi:DUF6895 family protein [Pediococcus acidilactici]|uniref:DUF6895 family protein n=1 Tax=Pediococcus acidilactici TaxID=1254 RepID=UPI000FFE2AB3|nr:hypothetical protein [Pediococcus acidilactici]QAT20860.1 hypothetical protein EQZ51_04995 [Pediococcus acidilactici]
MKKNLSSSINYLCKNLDCFKTEPEEYRNEYIKPFIELVFCYNMLPDKILNKREMLPFKEFIYGEIKNKEFGTKLSYNLKALTGVCVLEEFLLKNYRSMYKNILKSYVEYRKVDLKFERTPFRMMDTKYSLNKAGIKDNLPSYEEIYAETILGKGLSIYYLRPMTEYSITHTIFYLTDMGRTTKYNWLLHPKVNLLEKMMMECMLKKDLDILGELVLCGIFLNLQSNDKFVNTLKQGYEYIEKSQDSDGSFPAPIDHKYFDRKKRFNERYHTTLVCTGVLACFQEIKNCYNL